MLKEKKVYKNMNTEKQESQEALLGASYHKSEGFFLGNPQISYL